MTIDLDQLERLEKEATPGPWTGLWVDNWDDLRISRITDDPKTTDEDREFIAAMRNALPELIRLARIGQEYEDRDPPHD